MEQLNIFNAKNLEENLKEAFSDKTEEELRKGESEKLVEKLLGMLSESSKNLKS